MINLSFDPGLRPALCNYMALNAAPGHWNMPSWKAPVWRVHWTNSSGAAIKLGRQILPLQPSRIYVIPPDTDFGSIHKGNCRQFYLHFQIRRPYSLRGPKIVALPMTKQRRYFVRRIIAAQEGDENLKSSAGLLARAFLEMLIADLMEDKILFFRQIDKRLLDTLNYLEQHLEQAIDNPALAASMHVHPQTILRLFKTELGKSPQAYLRQLRVDKACGLLQLSEASIKSIAEQTGFCDRYHFTKVFTKMTGQSPARFRESVT